MRDNARRPLTILTVIPPCGWCWASPLSIGKRVIFSLCILLAGGAALWRQRRRAVSRQRSEIVLPPEDFQGAVVLVCGDTDGLFPGRSAHGETRHGWYLRGDSAEQLPGLAQYRRRRVRRWYRRFPCCWRWYRSTLREHLAQCCATGGGVSLSAEPAKRLPPVWSVFSTPAASRGKPLVYHHAERPARVQQKGQAPQSVAGCGRAALPHACIRRCGWRAS